MASQWASKAKVFGIDLASSCVGSFQWASAVMRLAHVCSSEWPDSLERTDSLA